MKTALVTGGNKGIGFAICKGLAEHGYRVFLGARDAKRGQQACSDLHKAGFQEVSFLLLDVSDADSIAAAVKELQGQVDHLDVLVNNAGIYLDRTNEGHTVDTGVVLETFNTNTLGPLQLTRALIPLLEKAGGAQVVNLSSGLGQLSDATTGALAYRISKTALNMVTRVMAHELSKKNIMVNSVCPGWVKTDMGGAGASLTTEQGAYTVIWLATGHAREKSGLFFRDRQQISW